MNGGAAAAVAAILAGQRQGRLPDDLEPPRPNGKRGGGLSLTEVLVVLSVLLVVQIGAFWGFSAWQDAKVKRAALASVTAVVVQEPVVAVHRETHRWCGKGGACSTDETVSWVETTAHVLVSAPGVATGCYVPMNGQTLTGPAAADARLTSLADQEGQVVRVPGYTLRAVSPWMALMRCERSPSIAASPTGALTMNGKTVVLIRAHGSPADGD